MPTFPSSILTSVSIGSGSPIQNPIKITEKPAELRGSSFTSSAGVRQTIVTSATRSTGEFLPIGTQFAIELFLDATQYVVLRQFIRQVGVGENALKFNLPGTFFNPNYPSAITAFFASEFKVGNTPMQWRIISSFELPAEPISNDVRGFYRIAITIEADLPF